MKKNIILIGYMGSGKSAVGRQLAEETSMSYLDLDNYIEDKEQKSIANIFKEKGEIYFRKVETNYLKRCLEEYTNSIISLGGGTPCFGDNMQLILNQQNSNSIYLSTSVSELVKRLINEKAKRPLISHTKNKEELSEFIGKHLFERSAYYSKSKYSINTNNKSIINIVKEIRGLTNV